MGDSMHASPRTRHGRPGRPASCLEACVAGPYGEAATDAASCGDVLQGHNIKFLTVQ